MPSSQRRPIIGGNWKMNTTLPSAVDLAESILRTIEASHAVEVVLFPPFPNLDAVHTVIEASTIELGAQNVHWEESGAFTGEVSAPMLSAVGCNWVILGHSERRHFFAETSQIVNSKLHAALHHELQAIVAIGETREERHGGQTERVCERQLRESLVSITEEQMENVVIAYEPVWAIGTGETASPKQARDAHAHIRSILANLYTDRVAENTRIQYGGSVSAENAPDLLSEPGIDGALVGGASLKPDDFAAIVQAASFSRPP